MKPTPNSTATAARGGLPELRKQHVAAEQALRRARTAESAAAKKFDAAGRTYHEARARFDAGSLPRIDFDRATETLRRDEAALDLARRNVADAEAALRDVADAIENLEGDLVQTGRLDENLEALVNRLRAEEHPDPPTAALRFSLEALQSLLATAAQGNPVAKPDHPAHTALLQSVHHLLAYLTSTPAGARKGFDRKGGLVYFPDEAAIGPRSGRRESTRHCFGFERIPVFFRGRVARAWGNIYLDR